jgi:hypothetical protein
MATIKLQPSGAVVLKDGKVSCTCCVSCGCNYIVLPNILSSILNNITSAFQCSILGINPNNFYVDNDFIIATWTGVNSDFDASMVYIKSNSCFAMNFRHTAVFPQPQEVYMDSGLCEDEGENLFITDFLINNITFPSYYYLDDDRIAPTVKPAFVFT